MDIDAQLTIDFNFVFDEHDDLKYSIPLHEQEPEPPGASSTTEKFNENDLMEFNVDQKKVEPHVGMEFDSLESAKELYYEYAERIGFRARSGKCSLSLRDDAVIMKQFMCYKEGFSAKKKIHKNKKTRNRLSIREGCKAMIQVKRKDHGTWVVTKFFPEHTHPMGIETKAEKPKKKNPVPEPVIPAEVRLLFQYISQGLSDEAGNCSVFGGGGSFGLMEYLKMQQSNNPAFFYSIQVDDNDRLTNVFWANAKARTAYSYFGDVIKFDTTYKRNTLMMPFVTFMGVNHHLQPIVFGCALLVDDTEASFHWLFETFLVAMCGCHPVSLVTDCTDTLNVAVANMFPYTCHRFCKWEILSKCKEKLPEVCSTQATHTIFKRELKKCIDESDSIEEFEYFWQTILDKYNLRNNLWMQSLYEVRHRWANVYFKDKFFAEISPSRRSETMHRFYQRNFETKPTLKEFIVKFDEAMACQNEKEVKADFSDMYTVPVLKTALPLEKQAAATYTTTIFTIFQEELIKSATYIADKVEDGQYLKYSVTFEGSDSRKSYIVTYDAVDMRASCSCCMFEFSGIMCRHVLRVLSALGYEKLPEFYFLKRWKKIARTGAVLYGSAVRNFQLNDPTNMTSRCNDLCLDILKYAEGGATCGVIYKVAKEALRKAFAEVASARKALCSIGHDRQ